MSTGPDRPFGEDGDDDDALSAFGSEEPSAPSTPASRAETIGVRSSRLEPFDPAPVPLGASSAEMPSAAPPTHPRSRPVESSASSLLVSPRFAVTVATGMAVLLGVVIGVSLMQVGRIARPASTTLPSATGVTQTTTPRAQLSGTTGRGNEGRIAPRSADPAAATASPPVVSQTRPNERMSPRTMPVDDRRTSRVVERASTRNSTATSLHLPQPTVAPSVDLDTLPLNPLPTGRVAYVPVKAPVLPPSTVSSERAAIRGVIDAYRAYCERLDAVSAATLWRGVDTRALSRAFSTLSSQTLAFDRCDIEVAGARAAAVCDGSLSYVRRVGDQTPQSRRLSWSFDLERIADRWMISGVTAR